MNYFCDVQKEDDIIQSHFRVSWRRLVKCMCRGRVTRTAYDWSYPSRSQLRYDSLPILNVWFLLTNAVNSVNIHSFWITNTLKHNRQFSETFVWKEFCL